MARLLGDIHGKLQGSLLVLVGHAHYLDAGLLEQLRGLVIGRSLERHVLVVIFLGQALYELLGARLYLAQVDL